MLELIIMIGVIGWFYRTAKNYGKNGVSWGVIGAISYYIPVLIMSFFIVPSILIGIHGFLPRFVIDILLSVGAGIGCCYLARTVLVNSLARQS